MSNVITNTVANTELTSSARRMKRMTIENAVTSVVPTMANLLLKNFLHMLFQDSPQVLALNALAMYHGLTCFTDDETSTAQTATDSFEYGVELAQRTNNDNSMKQFHQFLSPSALVELAVRMGWLLEVGDEYQTTIRWVELMSTSTSLRPLTTKITLENRRVPLIKGNKKKKPCKNFMDGIEFLQDRAYHVELPMLDIVDAVVQMYHNQDLKWKGRNLGKLPASIKDELYVLTGCRENRDSAELYSEWKGDSRGRKYQAACAGPNPQSGDMARAMDSHNVENWVSKDSYEYSHFFMLELNDCAKGQWIEHDRLMWVAQNPVRALKRILDLTHENSQEDDRSKHHAVPRKPFTYIRMVLDWYQFETTGKCDSRISFGEDAKCSGTQYLAILAGDVALMNATGLIESFETKPSDPYVKCLANFQDILRTSLDFAHIDMSFLTRDYVKTPYMAVQYSGGVTALIKNKDFIYPLKAQGIDSWAKWESFCKLAIQAVHTTLGPKVCQFIDSVKKAVEIKMSKISEERGEAVSYFQYTMADGFQVFKPCFAKEKVSEHFTIRFNKDIQISFGGYKDKSPWEVKAQIPDADTFIRTFIVNYIQGTDALIARTIANQANKDGLRAFTAIHDCFRCCLADVSKMHNTICKAYETVFIDTDLQAHLKSQIGFIPMNLKNNLTKEMIYSKQAYFFTAE